MTDQPIHTPAQRERVRFVCWCPSADEEPRTVVTTNAKQAAKLHVLRAQATADRHCNEWTASNVLVVEYDSGESSWHTVKVTIEASS